MHGGKALVRIFARAGVDYIFSSPGTEWPPVWEALAEAQERGDNRLRYINCRHEALAVAMASGYTKVTGKPQAVLLHATAGPLNAAMFLRAAYQERVPMVICAGDASALKPLIGLCESLAIPVMESFRPAFLNFPRNHALYLPYDPRRIESADLVLIADAVTPWYPVNQGPKADAKVVFLGDEYPYSRLPFWGYKVDLALIAPPAVTLEHIVSRLKASEGFVASRATYEARFHEIQEEHDK